MYAVESPNNHFQSLENGLCPMPLLTVHSLPGHSFICRQVCGLHSARGQRINRHLNISIQYLSTCSLWRTVSLKPKGQRDPPLYSTTPCVHSALGSIHKHRHACTRNVNKRFVYAANVMLKLQSYSNFQFRFLRACNSPSV